MSKILHDFLDFFWVWFFLPNIFFITKNRFFRLVHPLRGALGRAPPPLCKVEIWKKFGGKSVPENCTLFFGQNWLFRGFCLYFNRARPFGARWAGPPFLFLGWKYWKSSQEKVYRKTILYFFGKHSKRLETYLERQISSRGSGSNFFYPKLIGDR